MLGAGVFAFATSQARRTWVRRFVFVLVALLVWLVAGPAGATTFHRVSVASDGSQLSNVFAQAAGIANDGNLVLYQTSSAPLGFTVDANGIGDVCVKTTSSDGRSIYDTAHDLEKGSIAPRDIPSIAITRRNGRWVTLDNRRLVSFQMAGKPIPCRLASDAEVAKAERDGKFSSTNGGTSIKIRGGKTWTP